jgi:hypothetical protein
MLIFLSCGTLFAARFCGAVFPSLRFPREMGYSKEIDEWAFIKGILFVVKWIGKEVMVPKIIQTRFQLGMLMIFM